VFFDGSCQTVQLALCRNKMQRLAKTLSFMGLVVVGFAQEDTREEDMPDNFGSEEDIPEEMAMTEEQITGIFGKLDKDGDGKITTSDLHEFGRHMRLRRGEQYFEEFWKETDRDGDGKVTMKEAMLDHTDGPSVDHDAPQPEDDTTIMFMAADKNGDGTLNKEEALGFSSSEHEPAVEAALAKSAMKYNDKDGDGKLSLQEFSTVYTGVEADGVVDNDEVTRVKEAFTHMDKNGDLALDTEEMREWESGRHFEEYDLEQLAKHADADGDGFITLKELLDTINKEEVMELQYHLENWGNEL